MQISRSSIKGGNSILIILYVCTVCIPIYINVVTSFVFYVHDQSFSSPSIYSWPWKLLLTVRIFLDSQSLSEETSSIFSCMQCKIKNWSVCNKDNNFNFLAWKWSRRLRQNEKRYFVWAQHTELWERWIGASCCWLISPVFRIPLFISSLDKSMKLEENV